MLFLSVSAVLLQLTLGRPIFLFPSGAQVIATWQWSSVSSQYVTKPVPPAFQNFFTDFPSITSTEQFSITYNIWPENFINPSQALGLKGVVSGSNMFYCLFFVSISQVIG